MAGKHSPNRFARYQQVHETVMAQLRRGGFVISDFRYDSPHRTHNKEHHVHRYDVLDGDREGTVNFIPEEDKRPTLGEVVREAEAWYYERYDALR